MNVIGYWIGAYLTREQVGDVMFTLGEYEAEEAARWWQVREQAFRVFVPSDVQRGLVLALSRQGRFGLEFWVALEPEARLEEMVPRISMERAGQERAAWYTRPEGGELMVSWGLYQHLRRAVLLPAMR